jgi:cell division protein FtsB
VKFVAKFGDFLRRNASVILALGLFLILLQDIFGTHGVLAMRRSQKEAAEIRKEIEQLDEENRQLEERVKALKSDPAAIERIAREEMGLARPGEFIFKLPAKPGDNSTASPRGGTNEPSSQRP